MRERRNGTYVGVKYDRKLMTWAESVGVKNRIRSDHAHTTVIYSRVPLPEEHHVFLEEDELSSLGWTFGVSGLQVVDTKDGPKALIALLHAPELHRLHEDLKMKGATHDFPSLLPHVTLTYDFPEDMDLASIDIPLMKLRPTSVYTRPLDLNWAEGDDA